jgi:tetratricopeptide (TPR) repeat protein
MPHAVLAATMKNPQSIAMKCGRLILLAFVVAAPLVFSTNAVETFEDIKQTLLTLTALALIVLGAVKFSSPSRLGGHSLRQPLVLGVVLFLLSAVLSTVFSLSPLTSWRGAFESHGGLTTISGYAVLFFAVRQFGSGRRLLAGVALAAAIASGYALAQATRLDPIGWEGTAFFGVQSPPFSTLGQSALLRAYLAMSLPLIVYFGLRSVQRQRWLRVSGLAGIGGMVLTALVLTVSRPGLSERLFRWDDGAGRRDIWQAGWEIYRAHPVTGCGLDTFHLAFGSKRTAAIWEKVNGSTPTKAHNEAIHILATQGTVGGIALTALLAGLGWTIVQAWRRMADRALVAAVAASVAAFLVTNLIGFTAIATGSLFVVCAGLLSRWSESASCERVPVLPCSPWRRWSWLGVAVACLVVAFAEVIQPLEANYTCHCGDLVFASDPGQALYFYQRAAKLDPDCDLYCLRVAEASQQIGQRLGSVEQMQQARSALEQAVALVPADSYHHASLGRLLGELARTDRSLKEPALAEWHTAEALDPNNPFILVEAARTALVVGEYELASQYASRGLELFPAWAVFSAQLAGAALAQDRLPEAAERLDQAFAADWRNDAEALSRALMMFAVVKIRQKDFVTAQEYAGKASVWLPQWTMPHFLRVQALQALGKREEATQEFLLAQKLVGKPIAPVASSSSHSVSADANASPSAE